MFALEILEPQSQGAGGAEFRTGDGVVVQHFQVKHGFVSGVT
jgi:hypothetical protein